MPKSRKRKKKSSNKLRAHLKGLRYHYSPRMTLADLERLSKSGTKVLAEHLGMRMGMRRRRVSEDIDLVPQQGWEALSQAPKADSILKLTSRVIGYENSLVASSGWHYRLQVDLSSYVNVVQHLRSGADFAFLAGARMVFERWSTNRALSMGMERLENESEDEYYSRIWSDFSAWPNPGHAWSEISESLHGRGEIVQASRSYADLCGINNRPVLRTKLASAALDLTTLASFQMLAGVDIHAEARGVDVGKNFIFSKPELLIKNDPTWSELQTMLSSSTHPSDYIVLESVDSDLRSLANEYEKLISREGSKIVFPKVSLGLHLAGCLAYHRISRLDAERKHLRKEMAERPDSSVERHISQLYRFSAFSELALMLGSYDDSHESVALRTAGMALDSAWRLWLDDDDLSIACMRSVFEQTSRARVHRLKSDRALKMELRHHAPGRWLEAAGYKRLTPVGRALGEFSHYTVRSMREDARALLTKAQNANPEDAKYTARGNLLTNGAYYLATEISERLSFFYPNLRNEFHETVSLADLHDDHPEWQEYLEVAFDQREHDWRTRDFF